MASIANLFNNERYCIIFQVPDRSNFPIFELEAFKNQEQQYISFSDPLINHLLAASTPKVYLKLIQCCKYLYLYKKVTIIPNVHVHFTTKYCSFIEEKKIMKLYNNQLSKIWITELLQVEYYGQAFPYALSKFCSKIFKCQARHITINRQNLTEEEFYFLVQPELVKSLNLGLTIIKKRDGNFMAIEEVVERVPNSVVLDFWALPYTSRTFSNLFGLPRNNKLQLFRYYPNREKDFNFHLNFNVKMFINFVRKNAAPNACFDICFGYSTKAAEITLETAKNKIKHFVEKWIPQEQKPLIMLSTQERYPFLDDVLLRDEKDDILQLNQMY